MLYSEAPRGTAFVPFGQTYNGYKAYKVNDTSFVVLYSTVFSNSDDYMNPDPKMPSSAASKIRYNGDARYEASYLYKKTKDSFDLFPLHNKLRNILVPQTFTCLTPPGLIKTYGKKCELTALAQVPSASMLTVLDDIQSRYGAEGEFNPDLWHSIGNMSVCTRTAHLAHMLVKVHISSYNNEGQSSYGNAYAGRRVTIPLLFKIDGDFCLSEQKVFPAYSREGFFYIVARPNVYFSLADFSSFSSNLAHTVTENREVAQ